MEPDPGKSLDSSKISRLFLLGLPLGIANTLPGISGGTVALILHIYEPLIKAIKSIELRFLVPLLGGVGLGVLLGAAFIDRIFELYPALIMALIAGMILASLRKTRHEAGRERRESRKNSAVQRQRSERTGEILNYFLLLAGILLALLLSRRIGGGSGSAVIAGEPGFLRIFLASALASITMLLPGISGGSLLVLLGVYPAFIQAIARFQLLTLLIYNLGSVCGLLIFAWLLNWFIENYRRRLMFFLSGLILASAALSMPADPGLLEMLLFALGFSAVFLITGRPVEIA